MVWTEEAIAKTLAMLDDGSTTSNVAVTLGVTKNSVIGALNRRGVSIKKEHALLDSAMETRLGWPERMAGGCRWVLGDPGTTWRWCSEPTATVAGPYCEEHRRLAWRVVDGKDVVA